MIVMAQYDIKLEAEELVDLLSNNDKFKYLAESIINQVLDAQMTEHSGAEYYVHDFPNEDVAIRLIGALIADFHDSWITDKRYFKMDIYHEWKKYINDHEKK